MRNQGLERRHRDCLVFAFLPEHVAKHRGRWTAVRVPVEVHHVVKIAGPRAFAERPQLFSEGFLVGVAIGPDPAFGTVGVGMEYLAADRGKHQPFIRRQVELDLRPAARGWGDRAAVSDLALAVGTAARVFVDIEFELIGGDVQVRIVPLPRRRLLRTRAAGIPRRDGLHCAA